MNSRLTVAAGVATVLASIALYPLIRSGTWFWDGVGAVIVVACVGAATRRRAVPAAVCFLAAIAGEFLYLNAVFAHRQSWLGVVPTGASVRHLGFLVTQATTEMPNSTPPVLPRPGIVLAVVAGIGLVAALTDLLAVRLHRAAIAGLPLLVLFCVPLTTNVKPPALGAALVFSAGVIGYLGLLSADGRYRLRLWGRVVHPWEEDQVPDTKPLAAAGRRVGFAAVVLALFLPLLMPALRAHQLFASSGGGGGGGGTQGSAGGVSFPRPLDLLNADLHNHHPQVVLNYRVSGLGTPPYLQLYVLGDLTTSTWTMARPAGTRALGNGGTMPTAPGLAARTPGLDVNEVISLASSLRPTGNTSYLPVPYPSLRVEADGSWRVDPGSLTMHSTDVRLAGLQYDVTGKDVSPSAQQLSHAGPPPAAMAAYTKVPTAFDQLKSLAERITADQTSAYGKAVALQAWFHRNFAYSLTTRLGTGAAALVQFLRKTRTGSCQQFAFGMAVLARLLGIPSRVVIGFTQGSFVGHGTWRVMTTDAHAWPELYFTGAGWLTFEPTPPNFDGPAGQGTATVPPYSEQQSANSAPTGQAGPAPDNPTPSPTAAASGVRPPQKPTGPGGAPGPAATSQPGNPAPFVTLAIALLAALLLTPGLARVIVRRWRWRTAHNDVTRAHVAWRELRDELADHRIAWQASESPRALAGRLAGLLSLTGAEREALDRVARAEERASYAASPADSAPLHSDITLVRRAVTRTASRSARWTARIAPPSVLAPAFASVRHALDVFGWMELATTRARAHSPFRRRAPHPHIT